MEIAWDAMNRLIASMETPKTEGQDGTNCDLTSVSKVTALIM